MFFPMDQRRSIGWCWPWFVAARHSNLARLTSYDSTFVERLRKKTTLPFHFSETTSAVRAPRFTQGTRKKFTTDCTESTDYTEKQETC